MSLQTDKFFYAALTESESVMSIVDGRVFNPARPTVDEDEDKVPYIIISFAGLQNNVETKDDGVEGDEDSVTIRVLCVERNCDDLGNLTELVRQTMREYWEAHREDSLTPIDWTFSANEVNYDPDKPCCYQVLTYQCDTLR